MWQQFTDQLPQGLSLLGEGIGFYFGSALLVVLALIPTAGRIAGVVSGRHIVKIPLNLLLELVVFAGRVVFIAALLVIAKAMEQATITEGNSWFTLGQDVALYLGAEWAGFAAQMAVVAVAALAVNGVLAFLVTEHRIAKLLERMQNKATPGTVQRIIVVSIQNMIVFPIVIACIVLAIQAV